MYKAQLAQKPLSNQAKSARFPPHETPHLVDYTQNKGKREHTYKPCMTQEIVHTKMKFGEYR